MTNKLYGNRQIWNVSYPIFLSLLAQNVINVTDTAFLGRVGEVELGASAMGGLYYICAFTIAFGFSTGSQIVMARRNGEKNYSEVGPVMIQGVYFLFVLAAFLFCLSRLFGGSIMHTLISSETVLSATEEFLNWRVFGFFFAFINVMFRALFISITRTKVLTLNAICMAVTNVVLDYLLIFGHAGLPELGIKGAAIASVMAEAVSLIFFLIYTKLTVDIKKYALNRFRSFDMKLLKRVLNISVFMMLQYFISLSTFFMLFVAVERLGERQLAIANIVRSVYIVLMIPVNALSTVTNTFVSNSIGAGHKELVIPIIRKIALISLGIVFLFVLFASLFPSWILSVYTNEAALIQESIPSVYVVSGALLIGAVSNIVFNGVSGTGNTRSAFVMEIVTLAFYTLFIYIIGIRLHRPVAECFMTEILYYALLLLLSVIYLKKGTWQNKKI